MIDEMRKRCDRSILCSALNAGMVLTFIVVAKSELQVSSSNRRLDSTTTSVSTLLQSGHTSCPCLSSSEISPISYNDRLAIEADKGFSSVDNGAYGVGSCIAHDLHTPPCQESTNDECNPSISPLPVYCDRSWCQRSWCYIDPDNCALTFKRSAYLPTSHRYYSYATCGQMDSFATNARLASLVGRSFRVGLNSNTGGWSGTYAMDGQHFGTNMGMWRGPSVEFAKEAAREGQFRFELSSPPDFLQEDATNFYSSSPFDACVYAVSLGYLDFCIAQYTITNLRASSATWFQLHNEPIHLVVFQDDGQSLSSAYSYVSTILKPFTTGTWLVILFIIIPVLGMLMVLHELGAPGSSYQRAVASVTQSQNSSDGRNDSDSDDQYFDSRSNHESNFDDEECDVHPKEEKIEKIPLFAHLIRSIYDSLLALLQQSYSESVVTLSGKINLLGISFFILTIIAVYTANLAAILTQNAVEPKVESIEDALRAGYNFCGERKSIQAVVEMYGIADRVVPDPIELGGDGQAGFNCQACKGRTRAFNSMKREHSDRTTYCNAAIVPKGDLEVLQAQGLHCDKTVVGSPLMYRQSGFPVSDRVSTELISLFLKLKNEGVYARHLEHSKPSDSCPVTSGEGSSLSIAQLTGVWVITFAFAILAVIVKFVPKPSRVWLKPSTWAQPAQWSLPLSRAQLTSSLSRASSLPRKTRAAVFLSTRRMTNPQKRKKKNRQGVKFSSTFSDTPEVGPPCEDETTHSQSSVRL